MPDSDRVTVETAVARLLVDRGIRRVYALPGGHVKPIWDELGLGGVRIVSVRHEGAAVHMAQAEADLTGELAVAIVTTGPGFTNAVTGIACASLARSSILVLSAIPPAPQLGMGALEEIDQARVVEPITRFVATVREGRHVVPTLDQAIGAAIGEDGPAGPAYVDFVSDLFGDDLPPSYEGQNAFRPRRRHPLSPVDDEVAAAADLIRSSKRPVVVAGAGAKRDPEALSHFLEQSGALYLDTRASRGAILPDDEASVAGMRSRVMAEADLVITVGRVLDFELAFGSPAVFSPRARFLRVGRNVDELGLNRRGEVELKGDAGPSLRALVGGDARPEAPDLAWREAVIRANESKAQRLAERISEAEADAEGRMHPYTLIEAINELVTDSTIVVADGGDILSHARLALDSPTYLDLGPFGCLGVGVPFANAAALAYPDRQVIALIGDGAFGFHALEVETAVREGASAVFVIANNSAWNIERQDQLDHYGGRVLGTELSSAAYGDLARALGAHGEQVHDVEDLRPALQRALANTPAVVDVTVSREPTSADSRSGLATVPPLHAIEAWDEAERHWLFRTTRGKEQPMAVTTHEVEGRERPRGYSDVATAGPMVAIAGQLPSDDVLAAEVGFAGQYISALERFVEGLGAAGAGVNDILMLRIYVTDLAEYKDSLKDLASVFRATFVDQYPPTTLVEVSGLVDERARVEIEGLAAITAA